MTDLAPGSVVGPYRLEGLLGRGGFGEVWSATDSALGRRVAVKVLYKLEPAARERFLKEGRLLAGLRHPGLVTVYALGATSDGRPFLVMEQFGDGSVSQVFPLGTPVDPSKLDGLARDLLSAVGAIHAAGILHRDLKPSNVLYGRERGEVRLCDFGIAKALSDGAATTTGLWGSPGAMPPERLRGAAATVEGDLYGIGVVLYRLATGQDPFVLTSANGGRDVVSLARRQEEGCPPLPSSLPGPIRVLLTQLLAPDPALRPSSAEAARALLTDAPSVPLTREGPPLGLAVGLRWTPRRASRFTLAVVACVGLGLGVFWAAKRGPTSTTPPGSTRSDAPRADLGADPAVDAITSVDTGLPMPTAPQVPQTLGPPKSLPRSNAKPPTLDRRPRNTDAQKSPFIEAPD